MSANLALPGEATPGAPPQRLRVDLPHRPGAHVSVQSSGAGGLPCLFIHGFGEGGYVWDEVVANSGLPQQHVTVDLLGHGDSAWSSDGRYDSARHVEDLFAVADALRLGRFVVVGHSWGGNIAARMAVAQPERVVGLGIVDTESESRPEATAHLLAAMRAANRPYRSVDEYADLQIALRPLPAPARLREIAAASLRKRQDGQFELKVDPRLGLAYARASDAGGCQELLASVACPALVVRGAMSGVLGDAQARRMVAAMRACTLATVPAAGHAVMTDNPQAFLTTLRPFLRRFQVAAAPAARPHGGHFSDSSTR